MFLLYALSALIFVCANATRCREERFGVLIQSFVEDHTYTYVQKMYWVLVINLRKNHIVYINDTELLSCFPNLRVVDLRGNPNPECQSVQESKILMVGLRTREARVETEEKEREFRSRE